jgi:hypothetical protein
LQQNIGQIHLGFEYHQVANLPFTPSRQKKKKRKKKKSEKLQMLNSKSCQNDKTENRHVALIYRQYILHVTRLSTRQEESIQALCCKTLLLN